MPAAKTRILLVTIAPPENNHGVRIVMYRHLVERQPFEVHVVTADASYPGGPGVTKLALPYLLHRLRRSRFGPAVSKFVLDYMTLVWSRTVPRALDRVVRDFRPDVVLTLADNYLSAMASRVARRDGIPLAGLFLDWVPAMDGYSGHRWTRGLLDRRFRRFYHRCDLALCTSDGMRETLGTHPNSHVVYPMPGKHEVPETPGREASGAFRLAYVGSVENFYGRMLCSLISATADEPDIALTVVGPRADWPDDLLARAKEDGTYLGFKPPAEAAGVLAGADALLVVMSFEEKHRLFMETSFTTKFLDYAAFGKPVVLWAPDYCTPSRLATREDAAVVVGDPSPKAVVDALRRLRDSPGEAARYAAAARRLHTGLFDPGRLQDIFVTELEKIARKKP